jgi:signal transduction histidine kinase
LILAARLPISWASLASFLVIATVLKVLQLVTAGSIQEKLSRTIAKISLLLVLISFGAWVVGIYFGNTDAYNMVATISAMDLSIVIVAGTALVSQFNKQLTRELRQVSTSLNVAVVKLRQQQWLSRRRIASQVQLDVQGAVVTAIQRLTQLESSDESLVELARKDLDLALEALRTVPELSFLIRDQLEELRLAWSGVCEIEIKMSEAVQLIIDGDKSNALIVNAVVNEAVVNAVRQGRASWIGVTLIAPNVGFLEMEVRDNGHLGSAVVVGDAAREILALTTKSTLGKVGPLTVGTAEIPITDSRRTE